MSNRRDITIEFWARTPAYSARNSTPASYSEFVSFAAYAKEESECEDWQAGAACSAWLLGAAAAQQLPICCSPWPPQDLQEIPDSLSGQNLPALYCRLPPCAGGPSATVFLDDAILIEKYLVSCYKDVCLPAATAAASSW